MTNFFEDKLGLQTRYALGKDFYWSLKNPNSIFWDNNKKFSFDTNFKNKFTISFRFRF